MLFLKILFLCTLYIYSVQKTNEEPKINQGTTKELQITKMCCLLRLPSLFPLLYLASAHRPTTERTPREERINFLSQKMLFLNIAFLKRLTKILKQLTHFLKMFPYFVY